MRYNDGRSVSPVSTQKRKLKIDLNNFVWDDEKKPLVRHPKSSVLNQLILFSEEKLAPKFGTGSDILKEKQDLPHFEDFKGL